MLRSPSSYNYYLAVNKDFTHVQYTLSRNYPACILFFRFISLVFVVIKVRPHTCICSQEIVQFVVGF